MRVFISYTGLDLAAHADVVAAVLRKLELLAIDHRDSGATGQPSVAWCFEQVDASDIVIVLLAHRYGWTPSEQEGGDGKTSITWLEIRRARERGKIVLPYLVDESATWPTDMIEGLRTPVILAQINAFRAELSQSVAGFFTDSRSLDGPVSRDVPKAIKRLQIKRSPPSVKNGQSSNNQPTVSVPWIYDRDNPPSVADRMDPSLPKRILCLHDGLTDAMLAVSHLERIEQILQVRYGETSFRLADYFDLVVGSGFGAFLATEIALGKRVAELRVSVRTMLSKAFHKSSLFKRLHYSYDPRPIESQLELQYLNQTLENAKFVTGVALVASQLELGLPCHFTNAPNDPSLREYGLTPLSKLLLGCASQLTFYPPVLLDGAKGLNRTICSAAISGLSDPTLYAILLATNSKFSFNWRLGLNRMLILSVGGASLPSTGKSAQEVADPWLLEQIQLIVSSFGRSSYYISEVMLGGLSAETCDDMNLSAGGVDRMLTFNRFEVPLTEQFVREVGLDSLVSRLPQMAYFDSGMKSIDDFESLGLVSAPFIINEDSLPAVFDVRRI